MKRLAYIAGITLLCVSCSPASSQLEPPSPRNSNPDSEKGDSNSDNSETESYGSEDESVTPPKNLSGTYLFCDDIANGANEPNKALVRCALRFEKDNAKVDLTKEFSSYEWSTVASEAVDVQLKELVDDAEWHALYTVTGNSSADVLGFKNSKNMSIRVEERAGGSLRFASLGSLPYRWQSLNGGVIPSNAIAGGTEGGGQRTTFLCRSYVKNQVMPGKLVAVVAGDARSVCYTADAGQKQKSSDDVNGTLNHFSEVLVLDTGSFDDFWEWVPASAGSRPDLAVMSGVDAFGFPSYTCRALAVGSPNAAEGEQTPGQLRNGSSTCTFEFFGEQNAGDYQVLAWKSEKVKSMFEIVRD